MSTITTNSTATIEITAEAILNLARDLDPEWARIADGFALYDATSRLVGGQGITLKFTKTETVDTAVKAEVKAEPEFVFTDTRRQIVRNALFGRDSYIYAPADVQAKVEELAITAWMESGTTGSLSEFARAWYIGTLFPQYQKNGDKFPFQVPAWKPTADQVNAVLDDLNSRFSFAPRTVTQKDQIVKDLLQAWHDAGEAVPLKEFAFPWYRDGKVNYPA